MRNLKRLNLNKRDILISIGIIFAIIMVLILVDIDFSYIQLRTPVEFNEGWEVQSIREENRLILRKEITEEMIGNSITFYTSDSFVKAYIENTNDNRMARCKVEGCIKENDKDNEIEREIYSYGERTFFCKSPGSLWQFIELDNEIDNIGNTIRIEIETVYDYKYIEEYNIIIGSSGAIIIDKLNKEIMDILANLFLVMFGFVMIIMYILERQNKIGNKSNFYIGLISILTTVWSNCELFLFQLVMPTGVGQYFVYYLSFMLIPLVLMLYLEGLNDTMRVDIEFSIHAIMMAVLTFLQLSGIKEYTETLPVFLIITGVELIAMMIKLIRNRVKIKSRLVNESLIIMLICIAMNIILFFLDISAHTSLFLSKLGLLIHLGASLYYSFDNLMDSLIKIKESDKLSKIAYTDALTGVGNRYAFDEDIKSVNLEKLSLVSLDLNNLKYYNDTFGHICGDILIKEATKMLQAVYKDKIYRTGGDEFIVIQLDASPKKQIKERERLMREMKRYNQGVDTRIGDKCLVEIACGESSYQEGDSSYEDILKRADKRMYEHKAFLKEKSPIKHIRSKFE